MMIKWLAPCTPKDCVEALVSPLVPTSLSLDDRSSAFQAGTSVSVGILSGKRREHALNVVLALRETQPSSANANETGGMRTIAAE